MMSDIGIVEKQIEEVRGEVVYLTKALANMAVAVSELADRVTELEETEPPEEAEPNRRRRNRK